MLMGPVSRMQAAAKAQAEAEKRQKEEMNWRKSRLQASMAEVSRFADNAHGQAVMFSIMQALDVLRLRAVSPSAAGYMFRLPCSGCLEVSLTSKHKSACRRSRRPGMQWRKLQPSARQERQQLLMRRRWRGCSGMFPGWSQHSPQGFC